MKTPRLKRFLNLLKTHKGLGLLVKHELEAVLLLEHHLLGEFPHILKHRNGTCLPHLLDLEIAISHIQQSIEGSHLAVDTVIEDPHAAILLDIPIDLLACPQANRNLELLIMQNGSEADLHRQLAEDAHGALELQR